MKITKLRITNVKSFDDTGEIELADINVIVGRNNTGKSALLRAVHWMQDGAPMDVGDIRLGTKEAEIAVALDGASLRNDISRHYGHADLPDGGATTLKIQLIRQADGSLGYGRAFVGFGDDKGAAAIAAQEPQNFIYTYLSKRKVTSFDRAVDITRTVMVRLNLEFLVAKVNRLSNVDYEASAEYDELCKKVLGFRISTYASQGGHQAGISIGRFDHIPIEAMGEGVSSQLGLITDLCMADGNLFLIEELENDVHPESLKALLDVIVQKSTNNQFIITTHSNIVTRYLGAAPNSRLFAVESSFAPNAVPTATIGQVETTPEARITLLRQLGYELFDFDLYDGWLILEESSAEYIIRNYLIPWFVPRLTRIRTVAAGGTSKVGPMFEDFRRLFLYAHLEPQYRGRAWVVVDGDASGLQVVQRLRKEYSRTWPKDHFRAWNETDFERYYPAEFATQVGQVLGMRDQERRDAKTALVKQVAEWCDANPEDARKALAASAKEIVRVLHEIDANLFQ